MSFFYKKEKKKTLLTFSAVLCNNKHNDLLRYFVLPKSLTVDIFMTNSPIKYWWSPHV